MGAYASGLDGHSYKVKDGGPNPPVPTIILVMLDINKDIQGILLEQFDAFVLNKGLIREYSDNQYSVTYLGPGFMLDVELEHFETEEIDYYLNNILVSPDPFQLRH